MATDRDGAPAVVADKSLRRVIRFADHHNGGETGCRVLSLKRILDFDEMVRSQIADVNSLEYVREMFRCLHKDKALAGTERSLHVLGAIPPCFSQRQRSALRTAMTEAGFTRAKLVDDSLAALLACREQIQRNNTVLVYSWGASTFCASLYRPMGLGFRAVIAAEGDHRLGGDDIDSALLAHLDRILLRPSHVDLQNKSKALFDELERVKLALAEGQRAGILLSQLGLRWEGENRGEEIEIPRRVFEDAVSSMFEKTLVLVDRILSGGKCAAPDAVLLLGGTTRIPEVQKRLEEKFPGRLVRAVENAVALGAVIHGRMLPVEEWEAAEKRQDSPPRPLENPEVHFPPVAQSRPAEPVLQQDRARSWSAALDLTPLLNQAEEYEQKGQLDRAVEMLDELRAKLGKFSSIVYDRAAQAHAARGRDDIAFRLLREANLLDPTNIQVAGRYVNLCGKQSDRHMKAKCYRDAWGFAYEAVCAIERLPGVESRYPRDLAVVLFREACVLIALGHRKEAEEHLLRCIRLDPQEPSYEKVLQEARGLAKKYPLVSRSRAPMSSHRIGRNDPCPCGSGQKYKNCCLRKQR